MYAEEKRYETEESQSSIECNYCTHLDTFLFCTLYCALYVYAQVSENINVEENSSKCWQHEKASVNRLSTLVCTKPPQEKASSYLEIFQSTNMRFHLATIFKITMKQEIRAISSLFSTNVDSLTQSDAFMLQNDTLSMLTNLIDRKSLIR